ncbi:putative membrane protein YeaQ/YmgE (transglycosylase-associated protein family) [Paeniglutamicibacter psychrophenolicus]|nr:putative membrane protein YeaQ/YmgE (transglycosylase-associated protein family) [Paeniglutamicibacter psychrophenolicus]
MPKYKHCKEATHQYFFQCRLETCIATNDAETEPSSERRIVMGFIGWIVLGLIAGAIAKAIKPGEQGGGWIATLLLGIVGAVLGGWIGSAIFGVGINEFWDLSTWLLAIGGALIVLVIWGLLTRKRA